MNIRNLTEASMLALSLVSCASFAQAGAPAATATPGMSMQHCQDMMKGMDAQSCKDMMGDMHDQTAGKSKVSVHHATGVVKTVDAAKGTVTLAHGPVADLNWPAMTMGFVVKDKALLGKLAVDQNVEFDFRQQGTDYVVTKVR